MINIDKITESIIKQKIDELTYNLNPITKHLINQKINQISVNGLINYASRYGIFLSVEQAIKIVRILKKQRINIENKQQIMQIIRMIETQISPSVRNKVVNLIKQL